MQEVCERVPAGTEMIEVMMGEVHDHFRPRRARTACEMLLSHNDHEFFNGTDWVTPLDGGAPGFGGSADCWPRDHVAGDNRSHLSFWGAGLGSQRRGGCCSSLYADDGRDFHWNQPFSMNAIVATPSPTASPTPCTNIHTDPAFVDELPAPICGDMLAQNECGIPAIRARCNFTCTGCTAAPVIPPTVALTSHREGHQYT